MSLRKLVVIALVIGAAIFLFRRSTATTADVTSSAAKSSSGAADCVQAAQRASDELGNGISRFVNPPIDMAAWDSFRGGVESKIRAAEGGCSCAEPACAQVREAMGSMRNLLGQLDSSARSGEPFSSNIVQQQEAIDNALNAAHDAAR